MVYTMKDECLICGAPLKYVKTEAAMTCAVCGKSEPSKTRCTNGHYVCNDCHMGGMGAIIGVCLSETSRDPVALLRKLMAPDFCHMHGPEHHILVGAALLTAYKNAGGTIDLPRALSEIRTRGKKVPGGACGFWGACGAGISAGMFVAIATGSTPLSQDPWGQANRMTARALAAIGAVGGPRCCKRNAYLAITEAVAFAKEELGISMTLAPFTCTHTASNNQCIGGRCPFAAKASFPTKRDKK